MFCKVRRDSTLNEVLIDMLKGILRNRSPEIAYDPYELRFYKQGRYQSLTLNDDKLIDYKVEYLIMVEEMLRTEGYFSDEKKDAADFIERYCLGRPIRKYLTSDFIERYCLGRRIRKYLTWKRTF